MPNFIIPYLSSLPHPRTLLLAGLVTAVAVVFAAASWAPAAAKTAPGPDGGLSSDQLILAVADGAGSDPISMPNAASCPKKPVLVSTDGGGTFYCSPHPSAVTLSEGSSVTITMQLKGKPKKDRTVSVLLRPRDLNSSGKTAINNRGITFSPGQSLTFTPNNWNTAQQLTITFPENNRGHRDLPMKLIHKVNNNWKGKLVEVHLKDND